MTTEKPANNKQEAEAEPKAEGPVAEGAPAEEPNEVKESEAVPPAAEPPPPPPPLAEDRHDFWDTAATYLKKA